MGDRTNRLLLESFFLTLAAYAVILLAFVQYGGNISPAPWPVLLLRRVHLWLTVGFHGVPALLVQLFAIRRARRKKLAALPALALMAGSALGAYGWRTAPGWDFMLWGLLMVACFAPAAGCVLAWTGWGLCSSYRGSGPRKREEERS